MKMRAETNSDIKVEETKNLKPSTSGDICFPTENKFSHIKNKQIRSQQYQKTKKEKKKVYFYLLQNAFMTN